MLVAVVGADEEALAELSHEKWRTVVHLDFLVEVEAEERVCYTGVLLRILVAW